MNISKINGATKSTYLAKAIIGSLGTLAAAGSTQGAATPCTYDSNIVTSSTAVTAIGVILRSDLTTGDTVEVSNHSANIISVYPPSTGQISLGGASIAMALPINKTAIFRCLDRLNFNSIVSL